MDCLCKSWQALKNKRLYHVLKTILKSFINFQKQENREKVSLTFGENTKKVIMKTSCFFIIGDMQGGDKMVCSSTCYSNTINRLCRKCDVKGEESGNPHIKYNKIEMKLIQDMVEKMNLKNWMK